MLLNHRSLLGRLVDPVVDLVVVVMAVQAVLDHKALEGVLVLEVSGVVSVVLGHDPSVDRGHGLTRGAVHDHVASNGVDSIVVAIVVEVDFMIDPMVIASTGVVS